MLNKVQNCLPPKWRSLRAIVQVVCYNHNPFLSSFITSHQICYKSNTKGATKWNRNWLPFCCTQQEFINILHACSCCSIFSFLNSILQTIFCLFSHYLLSIVLSMELRLRIIPLCFLFRLYSGPSWWYGSCIYNYLYNKCLSPIASLNPAHGEVYSIQHCVMKVVSELRRDGGFLHQ